MCVNDLEVNLDNIDSILSEILSPREVGQFFDSCNTLTIIIVNKEMNLNFSFAGKADLAETSSSAAADPSKEEPISQ